jgi:hypothetical protein
MNGKSSLWQENRGIVSHRAFMVASKESYKVPSPLYRVARAGEIILENFPEPLVSWLLSYPFYHV